MRAHLHALAILRLEGGDGGEHVEGEGNEVELRRGGAHEVEARGGDVGVANGCYLVHAVLGEQRVERREERVEHGDDLARLPARAVGCEAHYVREEDEGALAALDDEVVVGARGALLLQLRDDVLGHHPIEEPLALLGRVQQRERLQRGGQVHAELRHLMQLER